MIRVLVAPKVLHDDNEAAVLKLLNTYNKQYKSFKYYIDDEATSSSTRASSSKTMKSMVI